MRIALDATPFTLSSGGQRRYVENLSDALRSEFPEDQLWLASDQDFQAPAGFAVLPRGASAIDRKWWLFGASRALRLNRIDVFHGTNFEVPYLRGCAAVLSLLDLSPWMNPEWHRGAGACARTPWLIRSHRAQMILTLSEAVRTQAIDRFGIAPERVVAVPLAANAMFRPTSVDSPEPYFVFVGTLEPRKQIGMLIEAWRAVRREFAVNLILAGRCREDFNPPSPEPGLLLLGEVPDHALPALYSGRWASLYPSRYEGFGLPVIEAMQCGAMVITSKDPAILEAGGDAALPISTPHELTEAMRAVIRDPAMVKERRAKSLVQARQFSWSRTARLTREVYVEALRRFR